MALPDDQLASAPVFADYESPYDRYTSDLTDFEEGGIAIEDGTQGLQIQIWSLIYIDDEADPDYGDFVVSGELTGETQAIINVADVAACCLAFNQNMDPFIGYELKDCSAKFYWYDTVPEDYVTTTLPAGSHSLQCCLDDHRDTQTGTSDVILAYIRSGNLYYRQQRDRFATEYTLTTGLGAARLYKVGMTENLRLKFDIREGRGVRLSHIVGDICLMCDLPPNRFDVGALYPTYVRGFLVGGDYTGADTIRALQAPYFFDYPEVDGILLAVNRGGPVVAQIPLDDMVSGHDADLETAREQGVEFATKLHLMHQETETDYAPTKATSERRSPLIKVINEEKVETSINFNPTEAAERVDILHKVMWNEQEGYAVFSVSEEYAFLVPSDLVSVEVRPGTYKRMRVAEVTFGEGELELKTVIDRASSYISGSVSVPTISPPVAPQPTYPGDTTWEFMDLPVLDGTTDTLHFYAAATGTAASWHGAGLQQLIGSSYETISGLYTNEIIGQTEASLASAPREYVDITNSLQVSLNRAPTGFTTEDLIKSKGAWLVGDEIIQVRDWTAAGDDWVGTYLLRGRLNTPVSAHTSAERVIYLGNPTRVPMNVSYRDTTLDLRAYSYGQTPSDATSGTYTFNGISQEEWAPHALVANQSGNDWVFSWTPRHRIGNSANPIPSTNFYAWRLKFTVGATTHIVTTIDTTPGYTFTEADQITYFGSAQSSFDTVEIMGMNHLGGEGEALSEAVS